MKTPKWEIALRAMRKGAEVTINGITYTLDIDDHLCVKLIHHTGQEMWVKEDMPFNLFVNECEKLSEGDMVGLVFTSTFIGDNE